MGRIAAINEPCRGVLSAPLADLLDHGHQLPHVAAEGDRRNANNDLTFGIGGVLGVEGGAEATIGHLHDCGLGIGGGGPRRFGRLALLDFELGQLRQPLQRLLDSLLTLPGGPLARRLLAPRHGAGVFLALHLEGLDWRARLLQAILQALPAPKRSGSGTGAHPHPVLRHPLERDRTSRHQGRDAVGEQPIERLGVRSAEIRQGMVVDPHAAADPAVGVMRFGQPRQLPRRAHPFKGGVQPQGKQDLRGNRRAPTAPFHRADAGIYPAQVRLLDIVPHQPCPVSFRQQRLQIART